MFKENILNPFNKAKINEKTILYLVGAILPSMVVAKSFEAVLVYIGLMLLFLITSTLISALINKVVPEELQILILLIMLFAFSISVNLIAKAVFPRFAEDFGLYLYILAINPLPYMFFSRVKEEGLKSSLVDTLATTLGVAVVLIILSLVREILGTGKLTFGIYTSFKTTVLDLKFSNYAVSFLQTPMGGFIILGLVLAVVTYFGTRKEGQ